MSNQDKQSLWQTVMSELETSLSRANFQMWLRDTFIADDTNETITIGVPSNFYLDWIRKNYHKHIAETLRRLRPTVREILYKVATKHPTQPVELTLNPVPPTPVKPERQPSLSNNDPVILPAEEKRGQAPGRAGTFQPSITDLDPIALTPRGQTPLDNGRTFESFIVGNSNRLAHAVSLAAAQDPGKKYNPLFLYGGVGLGKTHLAQAIGNEILKNLPTLKITYVSCEGFMNDFIAAVRNKNAEAFKKRFRTTDVLLIDDIQFMSGKERTQEEFFHTFNTLHQAKKQIVLTADREPRNIPDMEERLTSRFAWGMVADLQAPDLETRVAILEAKSIEYGYPAEPAALQALAQIVESNIRDLEGALRNIAAKAQLDKRPITADFVYQQFSGSLAATKNRSINAARVIELVSQFFELKPEEVVGERRFKEYVYPRQLVMYLLRHELSFSYPKIGKELGGKDHTTIMHGVGKIEKELARNSNIQFDLAQLKERLHQPVS